MRQGKKRIVEKGEGEVQLTTTMRGRHTLLDSIMAASKARLSSNRIVCCIQYTTFPASFPAAV